MTSSESDQVLAAETSLLEAMKAGDVEQLDRLLHDDLLFNGPTGATATKAMDLANYRAGKVHLHTLIPSDLQLNLVGNNAVVAVTVEIKGSYAGQEIDGKFRYLRIWQISEGTWKVIGGGVTPLQG